MQGHTLLVLFSLALSACSGAKEPSSPPEPASRDGLRPLTSRERSAGDPHALTTAAPHGEALPKGHPPIPGDPDGTAAVPGHGMPGEGSSAFALGRVRGTVAVAPELSSRLAPGDVLYIIARSPASRAVVGVKRIEEPTFPLSFELGSEDAMGAGAAVQGPLEIIARVSKSGDAIPSPGDLEGAKEGVSFGEDGVALRIDRVRK